MPASKSRRRQLGRSTAALVLGAGWSRPAGLPLASELFDHPPKSLLSWADFKAREVPEAFRQWRLKHPDSAAEKFVGRVYSRPFGFDLPGSYFPFHPSYSTQMQLPEPSEPCTERWFLRWPDMAEYLQLRLAWPLEPFRWPSEVRYKAQILRAPRCAAQVAAVDSILQRFELAGLVTTNYDVTAEKVLGVEARPNRPGFYYGDLGCTYHPPNSPFRREREQYQRPSGSVRMSKLHGSLNWSLNTSGHLDVYCDLRAAFRRGGTAAIVPPLPEKHVPTWLKPVWQDAFTTLSEADVWIVIGYSLPTYDFEVRRLFEAAYRNQHIEISDPNAATVASAFAEVVPGASFELQDGLSGQPTPCRRPRSRRNAPAGRPMGRAGLEPALHGL